MRTGLFLALLFVLAPQSIEGQGFSHILSCGDFATAVVQNTGATPAIVTLNDTAGGTDEFQLLPGVVYLFPCSGEFSVSHPSGSATLSTRVIESPWALFTRNLVFGLAGLVGGALIAASFIKAI